MLKRTFILIGTIISSLLTLFVLLWFLSLSIPVAHADMARVESNLDVIGDTTPAPLDALTISPGCIVITEITSTNTWNQPCYQVMNTVRVPITAVLTISPVTTTWIHVQKSAQIQVSGRLHAVGASGRITFTSMITSPELDDYWQGIFIDKNAIGTQIQSATIQYARIGVNINDTDNITIASNVFRDNGDGGSQDGAIGGDTDNSFIANNLIYSCSNGIALHESYGNVISNNIIYSITHNGIVLIEDTTFGGSLNNISNNKIYHCGGQGVRLEDGYHNWVLGNTIHHNARLDAGSAIYLLNQRSAQVSHNYVYSNGRQTGYRASVYITDLPSSGSPIINISANVIHDKYGDAIEYAASNDIASPSMPDNALCSVHGYELENRDTATITAHHNWWGVNVPKASDNYTGPVSLTPWITLDLTIAPRTLLANGKSIAIVAVTLKDRDGHTVPPPARGIELTTSLGTLGSTHVVVTGAGITTTVLTSSEPGTATITATAFCNYSVTATVVFTSVPHDQIDVVVIKDDRVGSTSPTIPRLAEHKQIAINDLFETTRGYAPLAANKHRECVSPGDLVTYTIAVVNEGKSTATNGVLTETMTKTMPGHVSFVPRGFGWTRVNSQTFTMSLGSLPPRTGVITYFVVRVTDTLPISVNNLVNLICVGSDQKDGYPSDNCNYEDTPICPVPDVEISKSATPTQVLSGGIVTYTVPFSNNGSADAHNVYITDTLPDGMAFGGVVSITSPLFGPTLTRQLITWYTPTLPAGHSGSIVFTATITTTAQCSDTLVNTVTITTTTPEHDVTNNTYSESVYVIGADVAITKTTELTQVSPGDIVTYTTPFSNNGSADAHNVYITDTLPDEMTFGGVVSVTPPLFGPTQTGQLITWYTPTLRAGHGGSIVFTATVAATAHHNDTLTNTITITTTTPECDYTNNDDSASVPVHDDSVDLTVIKDDDVGPTTPTVPDLATGQNKRLYTIRGRIENLLASESAKLYKLYIPHVSRNSHLAIKDPHRECVGPGDLVTYTMPLVNAGPYTATNVVLTDVMSQSMPMHASYVGGSNWTRLNNHTFSMNVGTLPPDSGRLFYLVVQVTDTLPITVNNLVNRVCVGSDQNDRHPSDNCNYEDTPICPVPDVAISKSATPTQVLPGSTVTFTVPYSNNGSVDAHNVYITDTLPDEMTFGGVVSITSPLFGPTLTKQLITWYTPTLPAGHSKLHYLYGDNHHHCPVQRHARQYRYHHDHHARV